MRPPASTTALPHPTSPTGLARRAAISAGPTGCLKTSNRGTMRFGSAPSKRRAVPGFRLPYATGLLLGIDQGEDVDLDATFVSAPTVACGEIGLRDPENRTHLAGMNSDPLRGPIDFQHSYVEAKGDSNVATAGRSGKGGRSIAQYQGSFDEGGSLGTFGYALILTGLSTDTGEDATDGRDMLPVGWDVTGTTLRWSGANTEKLDLLFNREFHFHGAIAGRCGGGIGSFRWHAL